MRVTVNLKEDIIEKAMILSGAKNRSQAINKILEEYVKQKQINTLIDLKGKLHLEDNLKALREMEINES
jgi:metal-responsive CopG/Arc/MetJ family transcriptional regulator